MNSLIKVSYDNDRPTVFGRELHNFLEVGTPYHKWFTRMLEYGFTENVDYMTVDKNVLRVDGTEMPQVQHDHQLTIEMAKEICMLQRNERGRQARQYFLELEKRWNTPEFVMARALQSANAKVNQIEQENSELLSLIQSDRPKVVFAEAVAASDDCILVRELAKLLAQNGVDIGEIRLFEWLRAQGYLINVGRDRNTPTQMSVNRGLMRMKKTTVTHKSGRTTVSTTPLVTGKGQQYFVNLFLKRDPDHTDGSLVQSKKNTVGQ